MCNSLLVCVMVGPRKSQNNGMNHLYTRFTPFVGFGLSPYKYLDSEREIDAGEDPTQGVSEYLASTTLLVTK